jgi:DNA polymerase-3 subunit gamma/tau
MAKTKRALLTDSPPGVDQTPTAAAAPQNYTVVARRYRPQQFSELIGQEHVAQALINALQTGRVAHAYLFTGSRGVGKTSAARILAKALNCVKGPTPTPCDECESCKSIAAGEDVDVQEIDGASNNKVEEARELRQNTGFRPTRSRFKIYIIDEVHMLSNAAFNALLKTLEEPPEHVKFIFATTEIQKIPITILSRCQRFDFANVGPGKIFALLKQIVAKEGHEADDQALKLIARRAGGSMRDSHSLLDQLLASTTGKLTVESVYAVVGSPGDERVTELAAAIVQRNAKRALELLAGWQDQGLQASELVEQMIGYWRSLMLVSCGGPKIDELPVTPAQLEAIAAQVKDLSLDTILAGLEMWTATRARMRDTVLAQVLLEMTVVRLSRMDDLLPIGQLVQAVAQTGGVVTVGSRQATAPGEAPAGALGLKKNEWMRPEPETNGVSGEAKAGEMPRDLSSVPFSDSSIPELWQQLNRHLAEKSPILANLLKSANLPAIFGPNTLVIRFPPGYNHAYEACATEANILRMQDFLQRITRQTVAVSIELATASSAETPAPPAVAATVNPATERRKQLQMLPMIRKAGESLGAQIWHVDEEFDPTAAPKTKPLTPEDPEEI